MTTTGTGRRLLLLTFVLLLSVGASAQEVLLPVRHGAGQGPSKADTGALLLPFFDDFASPAASAPQWDSRGVFFNDAYAPWPPTVGMATLDAFDAEGALYPTAVGQLFFGDTLCSPPLRLDSVFEPFPRPLTLDDSLYLSFFYLPGGGSGNMWERIGDCPGQDDSLLLEFYDPSSHSWTLVWGRGGESVDSLMAHTGTDWQYVAIPIDDPRYLSPAFRFRFRNYCSLDEAPKPGILSNSDQWNLDYILLDKGRTADGRASRDVAFVHPAPSPLKEFYAMPARQYTPSDMADSLPLVITNLYSEELATHYTYAILDDGGSELYSYDGGYENAPVFWPARQYQSARAHASPPVGYALPATGEAASYTIVHTIREGVSGDLHPDNDTLRFALSLTDFYAYDDGTPENGYGLTSTAARVRLAVRFPLHVEDTLTAVDLYFNRTFDDENASSRYRLTLWDDGGGHPGNIIYQDADLRRPSFQGLNRYVRYPLEQPVVVSGTLYVGLEQTTRDYLNLGFDRNRDASSRTFYLTGTEWQTSILRGALMLRPCFGQSALVSIAPVDTPPRGRAWVQDGRICISNPDGLPVSVYDALGRRVWSWTHSSVSQASVDSTRSSTFGSPNLGEQPEIQPAPAHSSPKLGEVARRDGGVCQNLPAGLYIVKIGPQPFKLIVR